MANVETYSHIRRRTVEICRRLETEDFCVQSDWFASPPKWHLGHTTWFFDVFCLRPSPFFRPVRPQWDRGFNSYYESQGERVAQNLRGTLSRPTVREILEYREEVDERMCEAIRLMSEMDTRDKSMDSWQESLTVGLQHEQQHQELLLMDIKANASRQIETHEFLDLSDATELVPSDPEMENDAWWKIDEGVYEIGSSDNSDSFDNERNRHKVYLAPARIRRRLVTNAEYLEFIEAGGYRHSEYWLAAGWDWVRRNAVQAPLYWKREDGDWREFSFRGWERLILDRPVQHISYYEARAFAGWKRCRLPTEEEWESIGARESGSLHRVLWQWTQSAYHPYPGFRPFPESLSEYNGKFMSGQMVLRGGSYATPKSHYRVTYRNFFSPEQRWQFSGIRLAQ